jgi:hypothetical protein
MEKQPYEDMMQGWDLNEPIGMHGNPVGRNVEHYLQQPTIDTLQVRPCYPKG